MSLQGTPNAERTRIGIFGIRNAGKSSLLNALTAQDISIVSTEKGTTTDPVSKAMELLPLGPVLLTDTPGLDDSGMLGELRIKRTMQALSVCDIALHVRDATTAETAEDRALAEMIASRKLPHITVFNKMDAAPHFTPPASDTTIGVSCKNGYHIKELLELMAALPRQTSSGFPIIADLMEAGDTIVLVTPIDSSAPKGRLILPQQLTIREIIDMQGAAMVVQPEMLHQALENMKKPPRMVVTDSQAFDTVSKMVPTDIPLTSFSILFARHKGILADCVAGAQHIAQLETGSHILISEGCTHHKQCEDIGSVKIPNWLQRFTGKTFQFSFTNGTAFPDDLSSYSLIVHCGGCMLHGNEVTKRLLQASMQEIPITNYGILIGYINGILPRVLEPLQHAF